MLVCVRGKGAGLIFRYFRQGVATFIMVCCGCVCSSVIERASKDAEFLEKKKLAEMQKESARIMDEIWNKPLFSGNDEVVEPMNLSEHAMEGDVFDVKTVPPYEFPDAKPRGTETGANKQLQKVAKKAHEVVIRGIAPELWDYAGCRDRQCFLQVKGRDFPAYSFIGVDGDPNVVQISHRKMQYGWIFVLDFPVPVKYKALTKTKDSMVICVKERRVVVAKSTQESPKVESLSIQEVSVNRSVITVRMHPGRNLDVRHDEREVLLIMPQDADLARHTLRCVGDAVRGCYVETAQPFSVLHIMLAQGVSVASTWVEQDEKSGMTVYKISLKHPKEQGSFPQGHQLPLFQDRMQMHEPSVAKVTDDHKGRDLSAESVKGTANDDYGGWLEPEGDFDVATDEVHVAQTSEDMSAGGIMAPEWLREAQRAYQEIRVTQEA